MKNKEIELNSNELRDFLTFIIENNRHLQENGKKPVAVNIEGPAGLGKTTLILDLAKELGLDCIKLNLSQLEELGDLIGFPLKEFKVTKEEESRWIPESLINKYLSEGWDVSSETRMKHAAPEWIQGRKEGGILILDDYTRADSRFLQATMELVDRQEYISWKLPKNWHIVLTSNPDNSDYQVHSIDVAQKTRYITVNMKFDVECWARWAESEKIDGRCINFLLLNSELVNSQINPRSITNFFNSISSISDFEKNLPIIQMIGEGSVGVQFATMFNLFIHNKLDKLISPEKLLLKIEKNEDAIASLKNIICSDGVTPRKDIASVMTTRIINFSLDYAQNNPISDKYLDRLKAILKDPDILGHDLSYRIIKDLTTSKNGISKFNKMLLDTEIIKVAVS